MEVEILWDGEFGTIYHTRQGLKNRSIMCSSTPFSHNTALGLMAQQHASKILPIGLGDLTCNGIIYKHNAITLRVLGDQTSHQPRRQAKSGSGGGFIDINGIEVTSTRTEVE